MISFMMTIKLHAQNGGMNFGGSMTNGHVKDHHLCDQGSMTNGVKDHHLCDQGQNQDPRYAGY